MLKFWRSFHDSCFDFQKNDSWRCREIECSNINYNSIFATFQEKHFNVLKQRLQQNITFSRDATQKFVLNFQLMPISPHRW